MTRKLSLKKLAFLTLCACAIPAAAIFQQYRSITIEAKAEDDCPYVYGNRSITDVTRQGDHVICTYR